MRAMLRWFGDLFFLIFLLLGLGCWLRARSGLSDETEADYKRRLWESMAGFIFFLGLAMLAGWVLGLGLSKDS
jgi:hypothetical protein